MYRSIISALLVVILMISHTAIASEDNRDSLSEVPSIHLLWDKRPIAFVVPTGKERMLTFPMSVTFKGSDVPSLSADQIRVVNNRGTLYIKALKPFDPIRVPVVLNKTGEVVLLDIASKPNGDNTPVEVVMKPRGDLNREAQGKQVTRSVSYVTLLRYAIQHLYAPERLVRENPLIYRTPMYTSKSVALTPTSNVIAIPLVSWRTSSHYVTAVLLKNIWHREVTIDPRELTGRWLAASFYPRNHLGSKQSKKDSTTVFLVSSTPFNEALGASKEYRQ